MLGGRNSWRETAEVLHDVVAQSDWDALGRCDRRRLLGLTPGEDWALFGRTRPAALKTVFGAGLGAIQDTVRRVAADDAFPDSRSIPTVPSGTSTELVSALSSDCSPLPAPTVSCR